jgi:hypothetical protein
MEHDMILYSLCLKPLHVIQIHMEEGVSSCV